MFVKQKPRQIDLKRNESCLFFEDANLRFFSYKIDDFWVYLLCFLDVENWKVVMLESWSIFGDKTTFLEIEISVFFVPWWLNENL
ncbi:hypothetical protein MASR2M52_05850 [Pedobacter sp.]